MAAFDHRYIVIGDVHGNWRSTEILLEKAHYRPSEDRLIFAGDYNDYLSYSDFSTQTTVDKLIHLYECAPEHVFFIRGNHDLWFRDWLINGGEPAYFWRIQGGAQTLESYGISTTQANHQGPETIPSTHKEFICDLVDQYYVDEEVVVVHGGFTAEEQMQLVSTGQPLTEDDLASITWDRYFIFSDADTDHALYQKYFGERYLIVGHNPEGPYVNPCNHKWLLVNCSPRGERLCAAILTGKEEYEFISA